MVLQKTQGATLLCANASTVSNRLRKGVVLTITCVHSSTIAFQVNSNNPCIYFLRTNHGVLGPHNTAIVDFDLKGNASFHDLGNEAEPLTFIIRAIPYPDRWAFDQKTWDARTKAADTDMQVSVLQFQEADLVKATKLNTPDVASGTNTPVKSVIASPSPMEGKVWPSQQPMMPFMAVVPLVPSQTPAQKKQEVPSLYAAVVLANQPFMQIHPLHVQFRPPHSPRNISPVHIRSLCNVGSVAYKVQSNRATWKLLNCVPNTGLIVPGQVESLNIFMHWTPSDQELLNDNHAHFFQIHGVNWPNGIPNFDLQVFNNLLLLKKTDVQSIPITVDIVKPNGTSIKAKGSDYELIDSPKNILSDVLKTNYETETKRQKTDVSKYEKVESKYEKGDGKDDQEKSGVKPVKIEYTCVELSSHTIAYKPPYGKKQSAMLACKNTSLKPVAFKCQTNKKIFYNIKPAIGTLSPDQTVHIEFEMMPTLTEAVLNDKYTADHQFLFTAYGNWKGSLKKVHNDELKTFQLKRPTEIQKIEINVLHEGYTKTEPPKKTPELQTPCSSPTRRDEAKSVMAPTPSSSSSTPTTMTIGGDDKKVVKTKVAVQPTTVVFKGPYNDSTKKTSTITITNLLHKTVAFKIQCNRSKFYTVTPSRDLLAGGQSTQVEFELNDNFTDAELKKGDAHRFELLAANWPKKLQPNFDNTLWNQLQITKYVQTINLQANFT